MTDGRLSVVICALGRPGAELAVASVLESARAGGIDAQTVLVWQSEGEPPPLPPGVEVVRALHAGSSYARNCGIAAASGKFVAFFDDDERATSGWAGAVVAAFAEGAHGAAGPILPADADGLPHCHFDGADLRWFEGAQTPPWTVGSGGNMAVRRDVLHELGGFDLRMGVGSGGRSAGDTELLAQILRSGGRVRWRPDMIVTHPTKTAEERLATRYPYGYGAGRMVRRLSSPGLAGRYAVGVLWGLREAARRRSARQVRELATSASGFVAGALTRDAWRSPERLLERLPAEIRAELAGRRLEAWPVPYGAPPHFLWAAGSDLVLHAYAGGGARRAIDLTARRAVENAGIAGVPALRAAAPGDDVRWVLEQRLTGQRPRTARAGWWSLAARWAAGLAATAGPPLRTTEWWAAAHRCARASPVFHAALEQIGDLAAVVVHGDLQSKNILIGADGAIGVVDWEGALAQGPAGLDLLYLAVTARPAADRLAAVRALARGNDPPGTRVLALLREVGLDADAVAATLTVSLHIWAAVEGERRTRLGVPPQSAQFEPMLACLPAS